MVDQVAKKYPELDAARNTPSYSGSGLGGFVNRVINNAIHIVGNAAVSIGNWINNNWNSLVRGGTNSTIPTTPTRPPLAQPPVVNQKVEYSVHWVSKYGAIGRSDTYDEFGYPNLSLEASPDFD